MGKVFGAESSSDGVAQNKVIGTKITLTETFSGQHLLELCSGCVDVVGTAASGQQALTIADGTSLDIVTNQALLVGGSLTYDKILYADESYVVADGVHSTADAGGQKTMTVNYWKTSVSEKSTGNTSANPRLALYTLTNQNGFKPIWITESTSQTTYQYVSQCSNRGACDSETGLCSCFAGYASDNCDVQNMVTV